jgi:hypothetical protein
MEGGCDGALVLFRFLLAVAGDRAMATYVALSRPVGREANLSRPSGSSGMLPFTILLQARKLHYVSQVATQLLPILSIMVRDCLLCQQTSAATHVHLEITANREICAWSNLN